MKNNEDFQSWLCSLKNIAIVEAPSGTSKFTQATYFDKLEVDELKAFLKKDVNLAFAFGYNSQKLIRKWEIKEKTTLCKKKKVKNLIANELFDESNYLRLDIDFKSDVQGFNQAFVSLGEDEKIKAIQGFFIRHEDKLTKAQKYIFMIVFSGNGVHIYFRLKNPIPTDQTYSRIYHSFAKEFCEEVFSGEVQYDKACSNPGRLWRLPCSINLKNESSPVKTKVLYFNDKGNADEILARHLKVVPRKYKLDLPSDIKKGRNTLEKWISVQTPISGTRHITGCNIIRECLAYGLTINEIRPHLEEYVSKVDQLDDHPYEISEAIASLKSLASKHEVEPFVRVHTRDYRSERNVLYTRAVSLQFLDSLNLLEPLKLRFFKESFYIWEEGSYNFLLNQDFKGMIVAFLQNDLNFWKYGTSISNEIITSLKGYCLVRTNDTPPFVINKVEGDSLLIPLRRGVVDVTKTLKQKKVILTGPNPNYFNLGCADWDYLPGSTSSVFSAFIKQVLPEVEIREMVQEILGYLLVNGPNYQKFFILLGRGANGKSVILAILTALLGSSQISRLPLDYFDQTKHRFALSMTVGKLVNIISELNSSDKAAEGTLKAFVGKDPMQVERKNKTPFEMTPSARIIIAANEIPPLYDRSDGLWRRMIVIPFNFQILDEKEQDDRLVDEKFWKESGELSAILEWALEGLDRLIKRGHFKEAEKCQASKNNLRVQNNPALDFISEYIKESKGCYISPRKTYQLYDSFCESQGYKPVGARKLTEEIKKAFPLVTQDKAPSKNVDGQRDRKFRGVDFS
jgi:P4 family phage/plasmid primase-like protien